jgi:hypothetical protein
LRHLRRERRRSRRKETRCVSPVLPSTRFCFNSPSSVPQTIPQVPYKDVASGNLPSSVVDEIKRVGTVVVHGGVPEAEALGWKEDLKSYIAKNRQLAKGFPVDDPMASRPFSSSSGFFLFLSCHVDLLPFLRRSGKFTTPSRKLALALTPVFLTPSVSFSPSLAPPIPPLPSALPSRSRITTAFESAEGEILRLPLVLISTVEPWSAGRTRTTRASFPLFLFSTGTDEATFVAPLGPLSSPVDRILTSVTTRGIFRLESTPTRIFTAALAHVPSSACSRVRLTPSSLALLIFPFSRPTSLRCTDAVKSPRRPFPFHPDDANSIHSFWTGWTALSDTSPGEGTLQVFPDVNLATACAYFSSPFLYLPKLTSLSRFPCPRSSRPHPPSLLP